METRKVDSGRIARPIIIVDAVCAKIGGHFLPTIRKFKEFFLRESFEVSSAYVCTALGSDQSGVIPSLPYCYAYFMPCSKPLFFQRMQLASLRYVGGDSFAARIVRHGVVFPLLHWTAKRRMYSALRSIVSAHPHAILFYPGCDFYSLHALSRLRRKGLLHGHGVFLRFMSFMEMRAYAPNAEDRFVQMLKSFSQKHDNTVQLSCETEEHSAYLSKLIGGEVAVTYIPATQVASTTYCGHLEPPLPDANHGTLKIAVLGGARPDKGYLDLLEIAVELVRQFGSRVQLIVQRMPRDHPNADITYEIALDSCAAIADAPENLSDEEFASLLSACDLCFLPYHPQNYAMKGSGVMFDALGCGIPVIARGGSAIAREVAENKLGWTYDSLDDLISHIRECLDTRASLGSSIDLAAKKVLAFQSTKRTQLIQLLLRLERA